MHGPHGWGDGESSPRGGRCLKSGTPAMHCRTAWGQWAVQLLQCTAIAPRGGGQWNSCNARAPQLGGRGVLPRRRSLPKERYSCNAVRQCNSCNALPHSLGAVGSATPAIHCHNALGLVGSGTHATHRLTAGGRWAVQLLQCAGPPPGGTGSAAQEAVAA